MTEAVPVAEVRAVSLIPAMVESHVMRVPIRVPVVPAPTKSGEGSDSDSQTKLNSRPIDEKARSPDPPRVERERGPVDEPRIVFRHINDFGVCGCNHNVLSLRRNGFLRRALQVPSFLCSLAHDLNRIEDRLLSVHVGIAER